jgi:hypothetical protein
MLKEIQKFNTPDTLYDYLKENIKYEGTAKDILLTPMEVIDNQKGHCWETANLIYQQLTLLGYNCHLLYIGDKQCNKLTHLTVIYESDKTYNWFELWLGYKSGIIGGFCDFNNCVNAIVSYVKSEFKINNPVVKSGNTLIVENTKQIDYYRKMMRWEDINYKSNLILKW